MNRKQLFITGAAMLATMGGAALAQDAPGRYIQLAEIQVDPLQLNAYKAAVKEHIETAVRVEPGVLMLYAASDKSDPAQVRVFEIYRDVEAYKMHLESEHFKRYKATTERMVKSLKLIRMDPIALAAQSR